MITGRQPSRRNGLARKGLLIATTALPALLGCSHALAQDEATTLDPINVQDRVESAFGPVKGYVANKGSTGTKTDTPLIETPQSISVITKDQIEAQGRWPRVLVAIDRQPQMLKGPAEQANSCGSRISASIPSFVLA